MKTNIKILTETISELSSDTTDKKDKNDNGPFSIIKDIIGKLTGGKNPMLPKDGEIGKIIDTVTNDGVATDIQNVFTNVAAEMNKSEGGVNGEPPAIGAVLGSIAAGLTSSATADCFTKIQNKINNLTGNGEMAPPSVKSVPANTNNSIAASEDAEEQE